MKMTTIAPCPTPWCKREDAPHTWQDCADEWVVICPSCGVNGSARPTEAEAIAAWHTRTAAQSEREAVLEEALRKIDGELYSISGEKPKRNPQAFVDACGRIESIARAALTTPAPAVSTDAEPLPVEYYLWLASIEPDVRVRDLTAAEVADLLSRIRGEGK